MRYLVTGTAGFIGFHLAARLLDDGHPVVGVDGFTPYYDAGLKEARNALLESRSGFTCHRAALEDKAALDKIWDACEVDVVVHLAAQAGVRYSLENPRIYLNSNIVGTFNLLERLRRRPVDHFLFASSSSVYGANPVPFVETDRTDFPLTLYAASKKANEAMAHSYSHLWNIPTTALRLFTVYGPWGRPDMALFKFTKAIIEGKPIEVFNRGKLERDFTYVEDVVHAIVELARRPPARSEVKDPSISSAAPFRVVNVGAGKPTALADFIETIEREVGRKAIYHMAPMQPGDAPRTFASTELLEGLIGYRPLTPLSAGVRSYVSWYMKYAAPKTTVNSDKSHLPLQLGRRSKTGRNPGD